LTVTITNAATLVRKQSSVTGDTDGSRRLGERALRRSGAVS
jgi:hypothetical protein